MPWEPVVKKMLPRGFSLTVVQVVEELAQRCKAYAQRCKAYSRDGIFVIASYDSLKQQEGRPDEGQFMAFIRAQYPDASYEQPPVHDFEKFVQTFAGFLSAF